MPPREHRATLDGILLSLHGSMVPSFCEDGEGELLRRLRAIVGPDLPIAATLDLHAMVTPAMVDQAQILVSYKTYPHVDMRETGRHAGRLLDAAMRGRSARAPCAPMCRCWTRPMPGAPTCRKPPRSTPARGA
jgi:microcystin degradation protein MlrC